MTELGKYHFPSNDPSGEGKATIVLLTSKTSNSLPSMSTMSAFHVKPVLLKVFFTYSMFDDKTTVSPTLKAKRHKVHKKR